jgi:hypothetical protein
VTHGSLSYKVSSRLDEDKIIGADCHSTVRIGEDELTIERRKKKKKKRRGR